MANELIRIAAAKSGVRFWQIAEKMNMQDYSLSRKMRHELPEEQKKMILKIIDTLAKGENHAQTKID